MRPEDVKRLKARVQQRKRRQLARVLPRMREPSDLAYRSDLLDVARATQKTSRDALERWLRGRQDSSEGDELQALFRRIRLKTSEAVAAVAPGIARRFVKDTAEANRGAMNAQYAQVIKVEPFGNNKGLERAMRSRVHTNIELITSIPEQLLDEVEAVVAPAVEAGLRVEEILRQLQERFGVSESRAQLIARDQVGKFNGELARERQEALGITEYVWSTSKDRRVRPDHVDLEGKAFSYDAPPIVDHRTGRTANPGEDYQCRCQALPRVEALLDSLGISDSPDTIDDVVEAAE